MYGPSNMAAAENADSELTAQGRKWFDCAECHAESEDHPLMQSFDMASQRQHMLSPVYDLLLMRPDVHLQEMPKGVSKRHQGLGRQ
jgi:uncharacterized CHY-type Zn-finger protein